MKKRVRQTLIERHPKAKYVDIHHYETLASGLQKKNRNSKQPTTPTPYMSETQFLIQHINHTSLSMTI